MSVTGNDLVTDRRDVASTLTITSTANPSVKAAARLASRKGRRDSGAFLVEGPQAVAEGLHQLTDLFGTPAAFDEHPDLVRRAIAAGTEVRPVTPEVLRTLADTVTPQGLVGVAPIANRQLNQVVDGATFVVVLDGVSDPGNAGTIIRTADAAGAEAVVFMSGSVDPFNPKAVRASTGSIFHLPIVTGVVAEQLTMVADRGLHLVAADARGSVPLSSLDLSRPTALVFGGETSGLSAAVLDACETSVHIPIARPTRPQHQGHAESLNLAAAVAVMSYAVHDAQDVPSSR